MVRVGTCALGSDALVYARPLIMPCATAHFFSNDNRTRNSSNKKEDVGKGEDALLTEVEEQDLSMGEGRVVAVCVVTIHHALELGEHKANLKPVRVLVLLLLDHGLGPIQVLHDKVKALDVFEGRRGVT